MKEAIQTARALACLTLLALVVQGCQSLGPVPKQQWSPQSIESFGVVAGKWAGLMVSRPKSRKDDWVRVTIADDGRYEFASYRTIGVLSGQGQFTLADGQLTVTTERGTATGSLLVSDGSRMLRITGVMSDGMQYTAELEPSR
ncbi:MAG: hypothetical protein OEV77_06025 [Nitrospira sp.]|nr:hypothetical protein [Nitrospira sp.]